MDVLQSDLEFQGAAKTLRLAPWLDMPKVRKAMQESLSVKVENGDFDYAFEEFREDIRKFCEGEYKFVPRSSDMHDILHNVLYDTIPEFPTDTNTGRSYAHIAEYLIHPRAWGMNQRTDEVKEVPF